MRYVVLGAGAVGGVVGANLHRAGTPVTLVARGDHLQRLRTDGLRLETPVGSEVLDVAAVGSTAEISFTEDTVVLLAVKSHQTQAALDDLADHAPPTTPVVAMQNGVANERSILRRFAHTYAICVMLPSGHLEPGVIVQRCHPTPGILDIGRYPGGVDATAETVAADLRAARFESVPRSDIMAWKHRKLVINLGNAVQACFVPGEASDELAALVRDEREQVLAVAGVPLVSEAEDAERRGDILQSRDRHPTIRGGSTWQSMARGAGSVETDYLTGEIVLLGRLHGVPTPASDLLQRAAHDLARDRGAVGSLDAATLLDALK